MIAPDTDEVQVPVERQRDATDSDGTTGPSRVVLLVVLVLLALGGLFIRIWFLGNTTQNADQATAGLIAREILHGHTFAFFWRQDYGGVEPYVVAMFTGIFGQNPLTLNAAPAVLALVGSVLVWRIGLRLFSDLAAACAAVLSWIWAESTLVNSIRETGYHQACEVLGLVVLLLSLRILQRARDGRSDRTADWAALGLAFGIGFWASPEIAYFAVPGGIAVLVSLRGADAMQAARRIGGAAVMAVVGSLPWLWDTIGGRGMSLPKSPVSYSSRVDTFFTHVLPMLLGLKVEGLGLWEGGRWVGKLVYLVLLALLAVSLYVVARKIRDGWILVVAILLFPFVYAAFPTAWYWNDGRYAIGLTPLLSLVLMGGVFGLLRVRTARWCACVLLVAAFASTVIAWDSTQGVIRTPSELTTWTANPNTALVDLAQGLERLGITHVYAGYWVGNNLMFMSDGHVVVDSVGFTRNPPEAASVPAARSAAWVFVKPSQLGTAQNQLGTPYNVNPGALVDAAQFTDWLQKRGIPYRQESVGIFDVVVPSVNVHPSSLGPTLDPPM